MRGLRGIVTILSVTAMFGGIRLQANSPAGIRSLERFIGVWTAGDDNATPGAFRARVEYEWGANQQYVKGRSFILNGDRATLAYESVLMWHPQKQQLVFNSYSGGQGMFDGTMRWKEDTLETEFASLGPDTTVHFRQTMRFVGEDRYDWTVLRKQDDIWVPALNATFRRQKDQPFTRLTASPNEESPLRPLARFVGGVWVTYSADGKPLSKSAYEWGINGRIIKARSYMFAEGKLAPLRDSVYYWHPQEKKLLFHNFATNELQRGSLEEKDGALVYEFSQYRADGSMPLRQTIRFDGNDKHTRTLFQKSGDEWKPVSQDDFVREKIAP